VTNSAKHGFPPGRSGAITVAGHREGGFYRISCSDNGSGDDASLERLARSGGLGARVIAALAASVRAEVHWSIANPGVQLSLLLPAEG